MLKKILLIFIVTAFTGSTIKAQSQVLPEEGYDKSPAYKTAIGIKLGTQSGITLKHFIKEQDAFEGIIGTGYRDMILTGLYERHTGAFNAPGLKWYYGAGIHIGLFRHGPYYIYRYGEGYIYYKDRGPSLGVDGIIGLEYKIQEVPLTVGIDIKPYFDFIYPGYSSADGALALRYAF